MYSRGISAAAFRPAGIFAMVAVVLFIASTVSISQPKYRTFNQTDLGVKKTKAGRVTGSQVTFTFVNPKLTAVQGFTAILSKHLIAVLDSGGATSFTVESKRIVHAQGLDVAAGDSITVTFLVRNRVPGTTVNYFWWTNASGDKVSARESKSFPSVDEQMYIQPNGGNMTNFLYRKILRPQGGLYLGIVAPDQGVGWVRNVSANGKYFTHTGTPRCLDYTVSSSGRLKAITRQKRNLRVKYHDNHLLGETHALKLAIIANDAGITEPTDPAENRLGDLIFDDGSGAGNPINGLMIREIAHIADSALTYCGNFTQADIFKLDSNITQINKQFDGPYHALSFDPFLLEGSAGLDGVAYLHINPNPPPEVNTFRVDDLSILEDDVPSVYALTQNYPNPFNPSTTIEFSLAEEGTVTLKVFDMIGREVATLIDNEELEDGEHLVNFNADALTSGVYFYRLISKGTGNQRGYFDELRKMILMK